MPKRTYAQMVSLPSGNSSIRVIANSSTQNYCAIVNFNHCVLCPTLGQPNDVYQAPNGWHCECTRP